MEKLKQTLVDLACIATVVLIVTWAFKLTDWHYIFAPLGLALAAYVILSVGGNIYARHRGR